MTPLPRVRKRTNYSDIKPDDLTFALYHDQILGVQSKAMSPYEDLPGFGRQYKASSSAGDYLVVEDPQKPTTWHLQVKRNGTPDHGLMGAAWAALHSGYRGNTYQGPNKAEALAKLRALYRSEKLEVPASKEEYPDQSQFAGETMEDHDPPKPITPRDIAAERARLARVLTPEQIALGERLGLIPRTKGASFTVYKDARGGYRWVMFSSNAFRDRDDEIVSTKALAQDVARADQDRSYGPLRWWHMGVPFGPGVDLGTCDYNAMVGKMLIESGTFASPAIGAAIAAKADQLQGSLGFTHPADEPDRDGVFWHIHRFERSLVPAGKAANPYTSLYVQEHNPMDETKLKALAELLNIPVDQVQGLVTAAQTKEAMLEQAGVAFKATDEPAAADPTTTTTTKAGADIGKKMDEVKGMLGGVANTGYIAKWNGNGSAWSAVGTGVTAAQTKEAKLEASGVAFKAADEPAAADPTTTTTAKAAADMSAVTEAALPPDAENPAEDTAEGGMEEPGDENMLTMAECQQIAQMTAQAVVEQLLPHLNIGGKMDEVKSMLGGMAGAYTKKDAEQAELKQQIEQLTTRLKELEGDQPKGGGYRASLDTATVVTKETPAPAADPLNDFISGFLLAHGGQPAATS